MVSLDKFVAHPDLRVDASCCGLAASMLKDCVALLEASEKRGPSFFVTAPHLEVVAAATRPLSLACAMGSRVSGHMQPSLGCCQGPSSGAGKRHTAVDGILLLLRLVQHFAYCPADTDGGLLGQASRIVQLHEHTSTNWANVVQRVQRTPTCLFIPACPGGSSCRGRGAELSCPLSNRWQTSMRVGVST